MASAGLVAANPARGGGSVGVTLESRDGAIDTRSWRWAAVDAGEKEVGGRQRREDRDACERDDADQPRR